MNKISYVLSNTAAVWLSGNIIGHINEVTLQQAGLT